MFFRRHFHVFLHISVTHEDTVLPKKIWNFFRKSSHPNVEGICAIWGNYLYNPGHFRFFQKMSQHRIQVLRLCHRSIEEILKLMDYFRNKYNKLISHYASPKVTIDQGNLNYLMTEVIILSYCTQDNI